MPSWQTYLLNGFLRLTMKRHGDGPLDLDRVRATTRNPPKRALQIPEGWRVETIAMGGDKGGGGLTMDLVDRAEPRALPPKTVVLYLHGGGYFFGSPGRTARS